MYQKILLTDDGSDVANAAIPHAITVAKATGAQVVLLHVIDSLVDIMMMMTPATIEPIPDGELTVQIAEEAVAGQRQAAEENLAKVRAQLEAGGVTGATELVVEGQPSEAIVNTANEQGCDLIVMATHGRGGLDRVLLGSVADHVVRHAKQAVLLVRPTGA